MVFKSFLQPPLFSDNELNENEPLTKVAWMHYSCAFWHGIEYKIGVFNKIEQMNFNLIDEECCICSLKEGACIKCHEKGCTEQFHVECA